jgi:hypothetical protein
MKSIHIFINLITGPLYTDKSPRWKNKYFCVCVKVVTKNYSQAGLAKRGGGGVHGRAEQRFCCIPEMCTDHKKCLIIKVLPSS